MSNAGKLRSGCEPSHAISDPAGRVLLLLIACLVTAVLHPATAAAHNGKIHQDMAEMAYELMRAASLPDGRAKVDPFAVPPAGYADFVTAMKDGVEFWRQEATTLPAKGPVCDNSVDNQHLVAMSKQCMGVVGLAIDGGWMTTPASCPKRPGWAPGGFLN